MMRTWGWTAELVVGLVLILSLQAYGQEEADRAPAVVSGAIKTLYPDAQVMKARQERNLQYRSTVYIVELARFKSKSFWEQPHYVAVTDKGIVLYTSGYSLRTEDVPLHTRVAIKKAAGDGETRGVYRKEYFVDMNLVNYDKPRIGYTTLVVFRDSEGRSIKGKKPRRIYVAEDGSMIELETEIDDTDLPEALIDLAVKAADGGTIDRVFKDELYADEAKTAPKVEYELWMSKGDKCARVRFSADGTVLDQTAWK